MDSLPFSVSVSNLCHDFLSLSPHVCLCLASLPLVRYTLSLFQFSVCSAMFKFENLEVWHRAVALYEEIANLSKGIDQRDQYSLGEQIRRAG